MPRNPAANDRRHVKPAALLLVAFLAFNFFQLRAQSHELPFAPGETALYGAYYNWHFIWVQAGEVFFSCDTIRYHKQPAWNFKAIGKTYKAYDVFYSVRDTFESIVSFPDFKPVWFRRSVNHGKGHSSHEYRFSPRTGKIFSKIHRENSSPFTDQLAYKEGVYDLLSSAYHFRGYDFDNMTSGQKINFTMLVDNKIEDLYFRYLGKEEVKTRTGRKFQCHKVSVWLLQGDFFPEGEYMKVWFTADRNRLPVMVETKIQIGSVKAILLDAGKLKFTSTAENTGKK
ncbi:DUF3108 domain-containing protein [Gaoshiqia sp. Z1-71]|uniref:DUF3108 domain-containing protein n=1 Tax=Gaoshiqia hydrogeniformans TaxID=3290090 RepID=UPI003BF8FA3F